MTQKKEVETVTPPESTLRSVTPSSSSSGNNHPVSLLPEPYVNATHMELFYFIISSGEWAIGEDHLKGSRPHIVKYAIQYPFLLHEILAVSALHLSTRRPSQAPFYRSEATRLQSHALRLFNETLLDLNLQNIIPAFLFSACQGLITFFETFHDPTYESNDWTTFFDNIVQSVRLLQGVREIVKPWWQFLRTSDIKDILDEEPNGENPYHGWTDDVTVRLEAFRVHILRSPGLDHAQAAVCDKAIEELIFVYKFAFGRGTELSARDQAAAKHTTRWFLLVSPAYTELLVQRKPEALVILGHFAILLHKLRGCWNVGDAAQKLLRVVEAHLEEPLHAELSWPKSIVGAG
jgi:Fungal specific transcription factor domain